MTTDTMDRTELQPFDGHDVISTTIAVTNAGDGLSKALAIDPAEYHHGEKVFVVLETEVAKVTFTPHKDDPDVLIRVHTLKAGTSTIVDHDLVKDVLTQQAEKNRKAEEERTGQLPLDDGTDPEDDLDGED